MIMKIMYYQSTVNTDIMCIYFSESVNETDVISSETPNSCSQGARIASTNDLTPFIVSNVIIHVEAFPNADGSRKLNCNSFGLNSLKDCKNESKKCNEQNIR